MASSVALLRPRGSRVLLAALAGLILTFGGACGVGPTSLSLLAVSGTPTATPDDARSQVPAPIATEVAEPTRRRRIVRGPGERRARRVARWARRVAVWWPGRGTARRAPPPRRGPPALAA